MRKRIEKYGICLKIFGLFIVLIIIPYLLLITMTSRMFLDYAGKNWGKSMEDTMISISNQVSALLDVYENSTMNLYYSGCVEMLEKGQADRERIESILNACCYSNSGVISAYLVSDDVSYYSGSQYGNFLGIMKEYEQEIYDNGGKCLWFSTTELYGRAGSRKYILARALNGEDKTNLGILYYIVSDRMIINAFSRLQMDDYLKYMVDTNENILYASANDPEKTILIQNPIQFDESSGYQIFNDGNQQEVVAYSTIPEVGWTFLSYISLNNLMHTFFSLRNIIILISAAYGLFLILVYYMFQKYYLKPISDLKYAMDQFAGGNMEIHMNETESGDLKNLASHFNAMTDEINRLIVHNQKVMNEKNNFKMQILMAKLHPHFIFNALNTIKWMATIAHQENIQKLSEALIYILMNNAQDEKEGYNLGDEIELIRQYAVIQKARFMNFEIEFDLQEEAVDCHLFQFILQPVVENAIVHGFQRGMSRGGLVRIKAWITGEELHIVVSDNGCGFDKEQWEQTPDKHEEHTNVGLRYIRQIIELEYGEDYGMDISSTVGEGTTVTYLLPANREVI
jgi:sensor histidine kinase YesM